MNRKKTLRIIIAILAIALACILPFIFANNKDKPQEAPTTEAQTQATSTPALPTVEESTLNELPSTTQKKNPLASIVGKCWFLYDKDENSCYAFLIKDDGNADIAYFGAETLDGLDAQYSTALSLYFNEEGCYEEEVHDEESGKLTIKTVDRRNSPWNSKIFGFYNL